MCHCAPVLRIHNTASSTERAGTGLRPARLSGMFSSGKCSLMCSHWSSVKRSMNAIVDTRSHDANDFEIGSSRTGVVERLAYVATRLTRFPFLPARRSDQSAAPEADHLPGALRHHGCRLALCLRGGAAARRAQHSIGSAQPHTHKRVLFQPGISHVRFSLPLSNARGWNYPRCGSLTPRYTSLPLEAHSPSKYSASSSERGRTPITMPPDLMPAS